MTRNIYGDIVDGQGRPSDLGSSATRNLATFAQMALDRMAEPHEIRPYTIDERTVLCAHCLLEVEGGRHSEAMIEGLRARVEEHDALADPRQVIALLRRIVEEYEENVLRSPSFVTMNEARAFLDRTCSGRRPS